MNTQVIDHGDDLLLAQARPQSSNLWTLNRERLTIGRDPASDVAVDDPGVSRHHADLVRRGLDWFVIDRGSTNGTYVNGARVVERALRAGDEIRLGGTELVVTTPGADRPGRQSGAAYYDVASQAGNINNVAGNQSNYYRESNLRYIASRRGRSRRMIVMGLLLFFIGSGIGMYAVLSFQNAIFTSQGFDPPVIPPEYIPLFGAGAFLNLLGIALFIFGLIARSNAKREAHRLGARW